MAYICTICGKPEKECLCIKYCTICKSEHDPRLCNDGCYYCMECREACDLTPEM